MGWLDYASDVCASLGFQGAAADVQDSMGKASGDFNDGKDQQGGGVGTAQQDRGGTTRGGVSTSVPAAGTDEESSSEKEVNEQDAKKPQPSDEKGHKPGDESGKAAAGQVGRDNAGPHGGPVGVQKDDDDDEGHEDEEEEEEEPVDPKVQLEEACAESQQCAPHKHHYDDCVERVTSQHEQHGKAHEDCVEEFFHLAHCASQCAAPKLFKQLK